MLIPRVVVAPGAAVSILFILLIGSTSGSQSVVLPSLEGVTSYQCATGGEGAGVFRVLTLTFDGASELAEGLCASPGLANGFSVVEVTWRARDYLQASHIVNEEYDYFWSREHLVLGLVPDIERYYRPLLQTPGYNVHWVSRVGPVLLEPAFFADKRVGLLADSYSQTFYVQPFQALKQAGIELQSYQKRFFSDVASLRQALDEGQVEMIPAVSLPATADHFVRTLMISGMNSGEWYLRARHFDGRLECSLLAAMREQMMFGDNRSTPARNIECSTPL